MRSKETERTGWTETEKDGRKQRQRRRNKKTQIERIDSS